MKIVKSGMPKFMRDKIRLEWFTARARARARARALQCQFSIATNSWKTCIFIQAKNALNVLFKCATKISGFWWCLIRRQWHIHIFRNCFNPNYLWHIAKVFFQICIIWMKNTVQSGWFGNDFSQLYGIDWIWNNKNFELCLKVPDE